MSIESCKQIFSWWNHVTGIPYVSSYQARKVTDIFTIGIVQLFASIIKRICRQSEEDIYAEWEKRRCFSFIQSDLGEHALLGEGICAAINYRWIKSLLRSPTKIIRTLDDLEGVDGDTELERRAHDRFVQAQYQMNLNFKGIDQIADRTLKKDGVKHITNKVYFLSICELIDKADQFFDLDASSGIINICAFFKTGEAHALGIQIDHISKNYRFWDVGSGFYQFNNLEDMKKIMQECCETKEIIFLPDQYILI